MKTLFGLWLPLYRLKSDSIYDIILMMSNVIVVDTSVLISALIGPGGPSRGLIRRCLEGRYSPLISNALFQEYEAVSQRLEIVQKCSLTPEEIRELLNAFYSVCEWMPIYYLWRPNLRDENDNFLVELAVAGNAGSIITNNLNDFIGSELVFPDLRILPPDIFMRS